VQSGIIERNMFEIKSFVRKAKNTAHLAIALGANVLFGFPAKKLTVIGVTGTDGKTTTSSLIYHLLKQAGKEVGMISTVGAFLGGESEHLGFHVTTPSIFSLQKYIKRASSLTPNNKKYLVLEVTSHALDQHRVYGVDFQIGVLTNISHEHLDYHKNIDNYMKTKLKLFKRSKVSVLNLDDFSYNFMKERLSGKQVYTYSLANKKADFSASTFPFKTTLIGDFNFQNCMAAVAVAKILKIEDSIIQAGLESFAHPEGRQHIVHSESFTVMIDFAHTPNAFEKILSATKKEYKGKIIHVFGSAGERDKTKRPLMGSVSSAFANIIILTEEDSRKEKPQEIMSDIESGIAKDFAFQPDMVIPEKNSKKTYYKVENREEAIAWAISLASPDDLVIITGKGHEQAINRGNGEEAWDEFAVARAAIGKKINTNG